MKLWMIKYEHGIIAYSLQESWDDAFEAGKRWACENYEDHDLIIQAVDIVSDHIAQ